MATEKKLLYIKVAAPKTPKRRSRAGEFKVVQFDWQGSGAVHQRWVGMYIDIADGQAHRRFRLQLLVSYSYPLSGYQLL